MYISNDRDESTVEVSKTKHKVYIVSHNLHYNKFQVIELYKAQARKLMAACDESF